MIENIVRHMEDGESRDAGIAEGRQRNRLYRDLADGIVDRRLHPAAVHVRTGRRMFREFALTLTIAVVTSAIVSLTLTPMMCSRLLKHAGEESRVPGLAAISRGIDRMVAFYHRTLLWVLQRQRATLLVTFAPSPHAGHVRGRAEGLSAAAGHGIDHGGDRGRSRRVLCRNAEPAECGGRRAIKADPDVIGVVSVIGGGSVNRRPMSAGW